MFAYTNTLDSALSKHHLLVGDFVSHIICQWGNKWPSGLWGSVNWLNSEAELQGVTLGTTQLHARKHGVTLAVKVLGDKPRQGREQRKDESHQNRRHNNTQTPPPQQEAGLMSGDGVQGLASVRGGEELDFGRGEARVVPAQTSGASCPFTHGVVAPHGVTLPQ